MSFVHSLNITDPLSNGSVENGGSRSQRLCIGDGFNPCDEESDFPSGFGFIGNLVLNDGTAPLSLSITPLYNTSEEPELKIFSIEELTQSTNSQGQQVLEGDAIWLYMANTSDDGATGTITAVNVGAPNFLEPISGFSVEQATREHREHLTR